MKKLNKKKGNLRQKAAFAVIRPLISFSANMLFRKYMKTINPLFSDVKPLKKLIVKLLKRREIKDQMLFQWEELMKVWDELEKLNPKEYEESEKYDKMKLFVLGCRIAGIDFSIPVVALARRVVAFTSIDKVLEKDLELFLKWFIDYPEFWNSLGSPLAERTLQFVISNCMGFDSNPQMFFNSEEFHDFMKFIENNLEKWNSLSNFQKEKILEHSFHNLNYKIDPICKLDFVFDMNQNNKNAEEIKLLGLKGMEKLFHIIFLINGPGNLSQFLKDLFTLVKRYKHIISEMPQTSDLVETFAQIWKNDGLKKCEELFEILEIISQNEITFSINTVNPNNYLLPEITAFVRKYKEQRDLGGIGTLEGLQKAIAFFGANSHSSILGFSETIFEGTTESEFQVLCSELSGINPDLVDEIGKELFEKEGVA